MGQYYKFINLDKKQKCEKNTYFLKLTEHSFLGNQYCNDILSLLFDEWKGDRVIHVGDYAEGNDGTTTENLISQIETDNNLLNKNITVYTWGNTFEDVKPKKSKINIRYVYNIDKKEFIDLYKQPIQWFYFNNNMLYATKFNSFALLTGCGNEQGGGDYYKENKDIVGYWAGDRFESSTNELKKYKSFKELKVVFNEMLPLKNGIKNYNENTEKLIFISEGIELEKYLKDNNKIDFSKITLNKRNLLNDEYDYLNSILNKYKNKTLNDNKENIDEKILEI